MCAPNVIDVDRWQRIGTGGGHRLGRGGRRSGRRRWWHGGRWRGHRYYWSGSGRRAGWRWRNGSGRGGGRWRHRLVRPSHAGPDRAARADHQQQQSEPPDCGLWSRLHLTSPVLLPVLPPVLLPVLAPAVVAHTHPMSRDRGRTPGTWIRSSARTVRSKSIRPDHEIAESRYLICARR